MSEDSTFPRPPFPMPPCASPKPDHLAVMAAVERGVRTAFERRYAGRTMTYEQARELVWMERDLVENIGFAVQHLTGEAS